MLRPEGTRIFRSSSAPSAALVGSAEAEAVVAKVATAATPMAVVNWRRDTEGMIILDLFSVGTARPDLVRRKLLVPRAVRGLAAPL
ncbi:hypothetical protein GCM10023160_01390 [Brachybacterium paraconglomeratum]